MATGTPKAIAAMAALSQARAGIHTEADVILMRGDVDHSSASGSGSGTSAAAAMPSASAVITQPSGTENQM